MPREAAEGGGDVVGFEESQAIEPGVAATQPLSMILAEAARRCGRSRDRSGCSESACRMNPAGRGRNTHGSDLSARYFPAGRDSCIDGNGQTLLPAFPAFLPAAPADCRSNVGGLRRRFAAAVRLRPPGSDSQGGDRSGPGTMR